MGILFLTVVVLVVLSQAIKSRAEGLLFHRLFLFFIALRAVLLLLHHFGGLYIPDSGKDAVNFEEQSLTFVESYSLSELLRFWEIDSPLGNYPIILAIMYKVSLWNSKFVGILINFALYGYVLLFMARAQRLLVDLTMNKKALYYFVLFALPMPLFYSIILLREMIIIFTVAVTLYAYLHVRMKKSMPMSLLFILLANLVSISLHAGNMMFFICMLVLFAIEGFKNKTINRMSIVSATIIFGSALVYFHSIDYYGGYFDSYIESGMAGDKYLDKAEIMAEASSKTYNKYYSSSVMQNIVFALPVDIANFTLAPYIIDITVLKTGPFAYITSLFYLVIIGLSILNIRVFRDKARLLLLIYAVSVILYTMGSGNYLQSTRHKTKFYPLIVLLVPLLLSSAPKKHVNFRIMQKHH